MIDTDSTERVDRVLQFIGALTHTKGEWAGTRFGLLDWQTDLLTKLFGTLKEDGSRQYRTAYLEIPKKNGKSELGAAVALYMLCRDGEASPEVYSAAADRDQASLVYNVASQMVMSNPILSRTLRVRDSRRRIINPRNGGFYQVLSSEVRTKHGLNPSAVIFDELHAQPNDQLWRVLTVGTDYARRQQLVFVLTTAGIYDVESVWWRVREKARQVQAGIIEDPSFLPILYIADPELDNPDDPALWQRVNPSLGRIFTLDRIQKDYTQVRGDLIEWEDFKRFRLNIPAKQVRRWMPMDEWDKCHEPVDLEALVGRPCFGGLDLSERDDLSAFALVWPPRDKTEKWEVHVKGYSCEGTVQKRAREGRVIDYGRWVQQGHITQTHGNTIDHEYIRNDIIAAAKKYDIREIGFDPYSAKELTNYLFNNEGMPCVEVRQGVASLSEPAKDIMSSVKERKIKHGNNPVLRWCVDNVVMVVDANANIRPAKDKSTDKIDLFVAMLIAWARALVSLDNMVSIYDTRGIRMVE